MEQTQIATFPPETAEQTTTLTEAQKTFAATNDPALSTDSFKLGDREFKLVHLGYRDYLLFLNHVQPLATIIMKSMGAANMDEAAAANLEDLDLDSLPVTQAISAAMPMLLQYAGDSLPELVALICRQTDKSVNREWVMDVAHSPFQLIGIVLQQVAVNGMIGDIKRFFTLLMPTIKQAKTSQSQ